MSEKHPALFASERSAEFAMAKNREGWLGLFAEDAFLADPVGKSILDRSNPTDVGTLALAYGGGGHTAAGTCQIDNDEAERVKGELITQLEHEADQSRQAA